MLLNDYDFSLPEELIAQTPTAQRDASRLLRLNRGAGTVEAGMFTDILDCFQAGDVLAYNDTRVIPARLLGHKPSGGKVEIFLVRPHGEQPDCEDWLCLTKSSRSLKPGTRVRFDPNLEAEFLGVVESPYRLVRFSVMAILWSWLSRSVTCRCRLT